MASFIIHEEALNRLCFICGQFVNKSLTYDEVNKHLASLGHVFNRIFTVVSGVNPNFLWHCCHRTTAHIQKGEFVNKKMPDWMEKNMQTILVIHLVYMGKKGRRKKKEGKFNYNATLFILLFTTWLKCVI